MQYGVILTHGCDPRWAPVLQFASNAARRNHNLIVADQLDYWIVQYRPKRIKWITYLRLHRERIHIQDIPMTTRVFKRAFDILFSLMMLIILFPLLLSVALLVKITSQGPILIFQKRLSIQSRDTLDALRVGIGRDDVEQILNKCETFTLIKFRSMKEISWLSQKMDSEIPIRLQQDPRITPIGRWLRRFGIDELPALWNVLIGKMTLIGPSAESPYRISALAQEIPERVFLLGVKPGLLSLSDLIPAGISLIEEYRDRARIDRMYIQCISICSDVKILFYYCLRWVPQ